VTSRTSRALAPAALVLSAALALTACGTQSGSGSTGSGSAPDCAATASSADWTVGAAGVTVAGEDGKAPTVTVGGDTPSTSELTVCDLVVGEGEPVAAGSTVTAQYVGVGSKSGKEFDSSWSRGEPATFPLDRVIEGWQKGIPGMKTGGRRLLVIPAEQAYGDTPPEGSGIEKGEALVFVVDLVPTPTPTVGPRVEGSAGVTVTGKAGAKPVVKVTDATTKVGQLTYQDLIEGTGPEVAPGATVTAHYVGVGANSGKEFDSSWDRGEPAQFPLANVIKGWQDGLPGMKVGGRRLLVIPAEQAYGDNPPAGSGIEKGEALVFVVDMVSSP
jgi:peptidylprolyl isomerase